MNKRDSIVDKVRKILALAKGAGTQEEAQAALLHAQRLMAGFHIDETELAEPGQEPDPIIHESRVKSAMKPWVRVIFVAVGKAFRCKTVWLGTFDKWERKDATFYGEASDVALANMVFEQAIGAAKGLADEYAKKSAKPGVKQGYLYFSCLDGFAAGLRDGYDQQTQNDEALMVVSRVPERVLADYPRFARQFNLNGGTPLGITRPLSGAYGSGQADGRQFASGQKGVRVGRSTTAGTRLLGK